MIEKISNAFNLTVSEFLASTDDPFEYLNSKVYDTLEKWRAEQKEQYEKQGNIMANVIECLNHYQMSRNMFSKHLGISPNLLRKYIYCKALLPDEMLNKMCEILGYTVEDLLKENKNFYDSDYEDDDYEDDDEDYSDDEDDDFEDEDYEDDDFEDDDDDEDEPDEDYEGYDEDDEDDGTIDMESSKENIVGQTLKVLRIKNKKSLDKVCKDLNISKAHLWEVEKGRKNPSFSYVVNLARYYGVSLDYLLGEEECTTADIIYKHVKQMNEKMRKKVLQIVQILL